MSKRGLRIGVLAVILVSLSAITMIMVLSQGGLANGGDSPTARGGTARVSAGASQLQTIHYQRCGHSVTRTIDAQPEWAGLTVDELSAKMDMAWRITEFKPERITMSKNVMLFCPQHYVLMPDETGQVCVFTNRYGDGMERVRDTQATLQDLPESQRELVRVGVAFDSEALASEYIESQTSGKAD